MSTRTKKRSLREVASDAAAAVREADALLACIQKEHYVTMNAPYWKGRIERVRAVLGAVEAHEA